MRANLKRMDIPLIEIKYGLASHYHIDHAGGRRTSRTPGCD